MLLGHRDLPLGRFVDLLFHMLDSFTLAYCSSDSSAQHSARDYSRERGKEEPIKLPERLSQNQRNLWTLSLGRMHS